MKKLAVLLCALCVFSTVAKAAEENIQNPNEGIKTPPTKEEMMAKRQAREAALEQKLGLTEEQKVKAKEIRMQGHEKLKPIFDQIRNKKKEAEMVKLSRIATWAQEEKLAKIDKEIQDLKKQANEIRKENMKEFESILTKDQKKILKQMKKEGRKKFEQRHKNQHPVKPVLEENK